MTLIEKSTFDSNFINTFTICENVSASIAVFLNNDPYDSIGICYINYRSRVSSHFTELYSASNP